MVYDPVAASPLSRVEAVSNLLFPGARDLCKQIINGATVSLTTLTLIQNTMLLAVLGEPASFLFGAIVVGGPVGAVIFAAVTAMWVYNIYIISQGGNTFLADLLCRKLLNSFDPNDIIGPPGFGDKRWIGVSQTHPYTIRFENDPKLASAPVQTVTITQKLDTTVDVRSFRMGRFGFANLTFEVPENRSFYSHRLDLRDSLGVLVDVNAGIDVTTNEAFWVLKAIDPTTLQAPLDPLLGLLPVDDSLGRGEGFVTYTVRAKNSSRTGDSLHAVAKIVFDVNEPINTPRISNVIDAGLPNSSVALLPGVTGATSFVVHWKGSDDSAGSGIRAYSVYVSRDDSAFIPWLSNTTDTSAVFAGVYGSRYGFYSLVTDNAGNVEPAKDSDDASTLITGVRELPTGLPKQFELYQNYPNPFNPVTIIRYDLPGNAQGSLKVYNVLGQEVVTLVSGIEPAGAKTAAFNATQFASGVYFYRLIAEPLSGTTYLQVRKMLLIK
jgi:hypothetical protein